MSRTPDKKRPAENQLIGLSPKIPRSSPEMSAEQIDLLLKGLEPIYKNWGNYSEADLESKILALLDCIRCDQPENISCHELTRTDITNMGYTHGDTMPIEIQAIKAPDEYVELLNKTVQTISGNSKGIRLLLISKALAGVMAEEEFDKLRLMPDVGPVVFAGANGTNVSTQSDYVVISTDAIPNYKRWVLFEDPKKAVEGKGKADFLLCVKFGSSTTEA